MFAKDTNDCTLVGIIDAVEAFAFNVPAKIIAETAIMENNFFIAIDLKFVLI